VYFSIYALVIVAFAIAFRAGAGDQLAKALGVELDSVAGGASTLFAAWVTSRATMPLRILATLVITPIAAKLVERFGKKPPRTE
jgi:hypothetical protein